MTMHIWRLEHITTKRGPFEHVVSPDFKKAQRLAAKPAKDPVLYIRWMRDVITADEENIFNRHPEAVFGWSSIEEMKNMIKEPDPLDEMSFRVALYEAEPIFHSIIDAQVVFNPLTQPKQVYTCKEFMRIV